VVGRDSGGGAGPYLQLAEQQVAPSKLADAARGSQKYGMKPGEETRED
jgi:hypothetical protein